jgi:hypothetical protein
MSMGNTHIEAPGSFSSLTMVPDWVDWLDGLSQRKEMHRGGSDHSQICVLEHASSRPVPIRFLSRSYGSRCLN